jgi:hypothetical protein
MFLFIAKCNTIPTRPRQKKNETCLFTRFLTLEEIIFRLESILKCQCFMMRLLLPMYVVQYRKYCISFFFREVIYNHLKKLENNNYQPIKYQKDFPMAPCRLL